MPGAPRVIDADLPPMRYTGKMKNEARTHDLVSRLYPPKGIYVVYGSDRFGRKKQFGERGRVPCG